ncbi:MAG: hypothetical protein M3Y59_11170 [Myxococcota bacterium]|nr:hypothetical protein [Myxococcota bacterium]
MLALTLLASNAATLVHEFTARHAVCAQHGEIIESGPDQDPAVSHPSSSGLPVLDGEGRSEGAHDHCAVLAELRSRLAPPVVLHAVLVQSPEQKSAVNASQFRPESRQLYRLAPKSGPPSLA